MSEYGLVPDNEQLRYDQEDDVLMRLVQERAKERVAAEQAQLDIEMKCAAAKYRAYQKRMRHLYHNAARASATLAGACGVVVGIYLRNANAFGVLVSCVAMVGCVGLSMMFDEKARRKKDKAEVV